jgi:hypothetical protein
MRIGRNGQPIGGDFDDEDDEEMEDEDWAGEERWWPKQAKHR